MNLQKNKLGLFVMLATVAGVTLWQVRLRLNFSSMVL